VLVVLAGGLWISAKRSQADAVVIDISKMPVPKPGPQR
jgi:hypothetical protein